MSIVREPLCPCVFVAKSGAEVSISTTGGTPDYSYSADGANFQADNAFLLANGQYTFTVRDAIGCEATTTQSLVITSLDKGLEHLSITAYPNPATNSFTLFGVSEKVDIRLLDETGKVVVEKNQVDSNDEIQVQFLKAGIYILHITTPKGERASFRLQKK